MPVDTVAGLAGALRQGRLRVLAAVVSAALFAGLGVSVAVWPRAQPQPTNTEAHVPTPAEQDEGRASASRGWLDQAG